MNSSSWLLGAVMAASPVVGRAAEPTPGRVVWRDDFEAATPAWKFIGGEEFPGAKGTLAMDTALVHGGRAAARLDADFRGGGAYVGVWKELDPLDLPEVAEIRFWARAENLSRLGVRVVDATGQCHQARVDLPANVATGWRVVTLRLADLVGGEHWGGANDGKWHGSPRGIGLNIGKDQLGAGPTPQATLWADDFEAVGLPAGIPTLRSAAIDPPSCRPGFGTRIRYVWDAEPLGVKCSVFVHFVDARGQMVFQADHDPGAATDHWAGRVEYGRTVMVPAAIAPGRYDVVVGLWDGRPAAQGDGRLPFHGGPGLPVTADNSCRIGSIVVAPDAPVPTRPRPTLDLADHDLTFAEDYSTPLSISPWGPGTRWIAHTPYAGDFGDAAFGDPGPDSPFTVRDGVLAIEARQSGGKWRSGLICSVDPRGQGFAQRFGYFEMRAKLPRGPGTWPAFWLMGVPQLVEPKDRKTLRQIEIDVVEQYGVGPNALHTTLHLWGPEKFHWAEGDISIVAGMTDDFHTYGVSVEDDVTIFYFDGSEIRRDRTPPEAKVPLYLMVDLALGGGWPIGDTPNPSVLLVDHVRAYARRLPSGGAVAPHRVDNPAVAPHNPR